MEAMIIFTAGTTGQPKGVVHTHGSIEAQLKSCEEAWQWTKKDHILNTLPLHHVYGINNILNMSLWAGAQITMVPKDDDHALWDLLLSDEDGLDINMFCSTPTVYQQLIEKYDSDKMAEKDRSIKKRLQKLRLMVSGGAALP